MQTKCKNFWPPGERPDIWHFGDSLKCHSGCPSRMTARYAIRADTFLFISMEETVLCLHPEKVSVHAKHSLSDFYPDCSFQCLFSALDEQQKRPLGRHSLFLFPLGRARSYTSGDRHAGKREYAWTSKKGLSGIPHQTLLSIGAS